MNKDITAQMLNKVPAVTVSFWLIKIMATTVGETSADLLNSTFNLGLTRLSLLMAGVLAALLVAQFRKDRYVPWIYWLTVVLVSVVGTLITDNLTDNFGVPLTITTPIFLIALVTTFAVWYSFEKTLSIHTIFTTRRELFYWAAILLTFSLGTAAGDLMAETLKLGYLPSAITFGTGIAVIALAYYVLKLNAIWSFWLAYILTRPFGASFGDWLSQPAAKGGLGLGTVETSALFLTVILILIGYMTWSARSSPGRQP